MELFTRYFRLFPLLVLVVCTIQLTCVYAQGSRSGDILYTGTFSVRGSKGIYVFQFNRSDGTLTEIQTVQAGASPSFMDISPDRKFLYSINGDEGGKVAAFRIDPSSGSLEVINSRTSKGGPAHVSVDPRGRFVYVSNYGGGSLNVFPINNDGSLADASQNIVYQGSGPNPQRQTAPHTHSAVPSKDGKFLYVSDLGTDKIMIYKVRRGGKLTPARMPFYESTPGAGPRHFTIHPNGKFAFAANELSSTLTTFQVSRSTGKLTRVQEVAMFPADFKQPTYAADVHVSPDGKFVYASNRGHDSLVIFAVDTNSGNLTLVDYVSTGGNFPRNFLMDSKGEYVLVANQNSDNIIVFKRDDASGKLTRIREYAVPAPVCIQQLTGI